jgi:ribosomal RNA-processing protein 36
MVTIKELASSDSEDSSTGESMDEDDVLPPKTTRRLRSVDGEREDESHSEDGSDNSEDGSGDSEDDSEESHASEETEEVESDDDPEKDLRHLPLGERLKLQLEKGTGTKGKLPTSKPASSSPVTAAAKGARPLEVRSPKKKSKHAPTEASSRRRDFYLHQQFHRVGSVAVGTSVDVHAHRYRPRDPREMPAEGTGNTQHPEDYAFLQEMRIQEIANLQRRLQARRCTGNRGQEQRKRYGIRHDDTEGLQQDQKELHRLLQEKAAYERQQLDRAAQQAVRQNWKAAAGESTAARQYRPKQREWKRMYMEAKYDLLQEKKGGSATIDQMLEKRRKKQKSRHSKMPSVL